MFMNFNKKFGLLSLRNSMVLLFCISLFSTSITFGWTREDEILLSEAITKGDATKVEKIVNEKKIDLNGYLHHDYEEPGVDTPLTYAIKKRKVEVVRKLLELGAKIKLGYGTRRMTPLMTLLYPRYWFTYENETPEDQKKIFEIAELLLDAGDDPNARNSHGMTPLIEAIRNRVSVDIVKLLLQHGADPTIKDFGGRNASDHTRKKDVEIRKLLEKYTPGHSSVATNPTGSNDGADSGSGAGSAASGNPAASQSGIGQSDNPSGSKTQLSGKKRPLEEDEEEEEDNNDGDNGDEEPSEGTGSLAKFGDSFGSETHNVPGDGNGLSTVAEPNHKKARTRAPGSGTAAGASSATPFGSIAMGAAGGGGASSSSSSSAPIGPNHIDGYELIEVPGDGDRFFAAVANRLLTGGHPIMHGLHAGAGQAPEELLLSRLPANEDEIARVTTTLNDIYIAIIDTRNPQAGFTYFHQGRQLKSGERATSTPGHPVIMLAFNGSYYLVVNSVSQKAAGQIDPKPSIHLSGPRPRPPGGPGGSGAGFGGLSSSLKNTFG
jgi:hypothetical protein